MALTPQNLIDDAKLQAWPYLREEDISPAALLRQLTSLDREIVGFIGIHVPERLTSQATDITIVTANNQAGYALTAAKIYTDFTYVDKDGNRIPIEIAPEGKEPSRHPAAYIYGTTFRPIDPLDVSWNASFGLRTLYIGDGDKVQYRFIAEPSRVTTMSQTLVSPDECESYFRESLTLTVLLQSAAPPERLQVATQLLLASKQQLLHQLTKKTGVSARYGE